MIFKTADAFESNVITPVEFLRSVYGPEIRIASEFEKTCKELLSDRIGNYVFSHSTIIVSVDTEEDQDWLIKPESIQFVNANKDAWERNLLLATYKTFVGKPNYVNHVQVPQLAVGTIVDAVPVVYKDAVYIHILTATHKKHKIAKDIVDRTVRAMSMGASVEYVICSQCGKKITDYDVDACSHVLLNQGQLFLDEKGKTRIIAELCGHKNDPNSNEFIEASWVENPAFIHAQTHQVIDMETDAKTLVANDSSIIVLPVNSNDIPQSEVEAKTAMKKVAFSKTAAKKEPEIEFGSSSADYSPEGDIYAREGILDDLMNLEPAVEHIVVKEDEEVSLEAAIDRGEKLSKEILDKVMQVWEKK